MSELPGTAPDFSQPLQLLRACHERIRSQCDTLRRLAEHLRKNGCDGQARQAAANIMRYFETAGRDHHADEEENLLPHMVVAATLGGGGGLTRLVADIANEHREMDRVWTELRAALQEISAGEGRMLDALVVDRFAKLHSAHIAVEESSMFPLAELLLSRSDLARIGAGMAQRRDRSRG